MRKNTSGRLLASLLAASALGVSSSAWAGFNVSATRVSVNVNGTPLDRYDIVAVNTGGDTGTQIKGLEYDWVGSRVFFQLDDLTDATGVGESDNIPDTVRFNSNSLTRIRVNTAPSFNTFVGEQPYRGPTQWNPYMAGLRSFRGAVANTGQTQATGTGFQIARIFTLVGGGGVFSGNLGGDLGSKVPYSMYGGPMYHGPQVNYSLSTNLSEPVVANFGSDPSQGAPFFVHISVGLANPFVATTLTTTPIPGIRDVVVDSVVNGSTQDFFINGRVDYSRLYNPTIVPFHLGGSGFAADAFTVFAMPEPASFISALGLLAAVGRRRRVPSVSRPAGAVVAERR